MNLAQAESSAMRLLVAVNELKNATKDGSDALAFILERSSSELDEAANLIGYIGTTGTERVDVIKRAEQWLERNGYRHLA